MVKDRAIVCPKCGSKDITKRIILEGDKKRTIHFMKGRYFCRNCQLISLVRESMPFYLYKKLMKKEK